MDVGEEAFRGVAICCFCCPAVKTVGSYSQAPSFELEQSDFCVSVYETARERRRHRKSHNLNQGPSSAFSTI